MKSFVYLSVFTVLIFTLSISTGLVNAQMPDMQTGITGKYVNTEWEIEFMIPNGWTVSTFDMPPNGIMITIVAPSQEVGFNIGVDLGKGPTPQVDEDLVPYTDSDPCALNRGYVNINGKQFVVVSHGCTYPIDKSYTAYEDGIVYYIHTGTDDYAKFATLDEVMKSVKIGKPSTQDPTKDASIPTSDTQSKIPSWIKNNAGWWADGSIDDNSFVQGIQYLIKEGIMKIPDTAQGSGSASNQIPSWIKNNAGWWADGSIDDNSFVQGMQYLVSNGIINTSTP